MAVKTVNKKGLELAKDVLAQLRYQNIMSGTYFTPTREVCDLMYSRDVNQNAQKHMGKLRKCGVCARGALVLAYIKRYNNVMLDEIDTTAGDIDSLVELMGDFFSEEQLLLIEAAFERNDYYTIGNYSEPKYRFRLFPAKYTPKQRLRLIMQNVVKNGGVFVPEKLIKDLKIPLMASED